MRLLPYNQQDRQLNGRWSFTSPFLGCKILAVSGLLIMAAINLNLPNAYAQTATGTTHNNVAPVQLTLTFNFSYTAGDPFQSNAPPGFFPSPLTSLGTTNSYIFDEVESFGIGYEYKVTVQPSASGVKTNQMQISEAAVSSTTNYYTNGTSNGASTNRLGIYNITNGNGDTAGAGTAKDPILFAFDDPGTPMAITQDGANHMNVLKNVTTTQLTSTPQLLVNGSYTNAGDNAVETFRYVCTYYTNTAGTEPTGSTTNFWSGSPHWFGTHSP